MDSYSSWADIPPHLKTKTQLGKEGLRLAKGQQPAAKKTGGRGPFNLYDVGQAVPKRQVSADERARLAELRLRAEMLRECECGRSLDIHEYGWQRRRQKAGHQTELDADGKYHCHYCGDRVRAMLWARRVLADERSIILDTETTELDGQPVEIAVIDVVGNVLLNTLVQATVPVEPGAYNVHGIGADALATAPAFPEIYPELCRIMSEASRIVIYNAGFDCDILERARAVHDLPVYPGLRDAECVMEMYAMWVNDWSDYHGSYRWQALQGDHRALGDCRATLACLERMAEIGGS